MPKLHLPPSLPPRRTAAHWETRPTTVIGPDSGRLSFGAQSPSGTAHDWREPMNERSATRSGLPVLHERAVGIDIGSRFHVAAVPADLADEPCNEGESLYGCARTRSRMRELTSISLPISL